MSFCTDLRNMRFVFWPYDLYPFTLGAEAMPRPSGMWYVPTFQMTVRPLAIFDIEEGKGILKELQNLKEERRITLRNIDQAFSLRAIEFAPFLKA